MEFLSSGFNILLIILGFGLLIFVHELGHFLAAKWAGIRTEAFAIGMGPVVIAWRKGIGLRLGSTEAATEQRIREYLKREPGASAGQQQHISLEQRRRAEEALGIGETEYSLRWLPFGGFVKMLGQEDANPNYVSDDPRSYNRCAIGKRMVVVSAGVIMNILLAIVLFIAAFMVGVRFPAPVVGDVARQMPAGQVMPENAQALGISLPGLQSGDIVTHIDGKPAVTFADLQIASAMAKPGSQVSLTVSRSGFEEPLQFTLTPDKDPTSGLLSIGVAPASSTTLLSRDREGYLDTVLQQTGLAAAGIQPGMRMVSVNGQPVHTFQQFEQLVRNSAGQALQTTWTMTDEHGKPAGSELQAFIPVKPSFDILRYADSDTNAVQNFELGLFGFTPLSQITDVPAHSQNAQVLRAGDVILRIGSLDGPRMADVRREISRRPRESVQLHVLRDNEEIQVTAEVSRKGLLNVALGYAWDLPLIAQPMAEVRENNAEGTTVERRTPLAELQLFARTRIDAVDGTPVQNWADIRQAMRAATESALNEETGAAVELLTTLPTPGHPQERITLELSQQDVATLHELAWQTELPSFIFEPIHTVRSAGGSPVKAVMMGFEETHKLIMMTYLTIDRLFRGSVGVEQLHGPVGIVHVGSQVADRGFMYLVFFLGMISVNLAVINFLPLPIVDGGLFLFLIYEKFRGRPPSLAFQNVVTIIGLCLIVSLFLVVTWNDVMRLLS